jgi:hypothetical protein
LSREEKVILFYEKGMLKNTKLFAEAVITSISLSSLSIFLLYVWHDYYGNRVENGEVQK